MACRIAAGAWRATVEPPRPFIVFFFVVVVRIFGVFGLQGEHVCRSRVAFDEPKAFFFRGGFEARGGVLLAALAGAETEAGQGAAMLFVGDIRGRGRCRGVLLAVAMEDV